MVLKLHEDSRAHEESGIAEFMRAIRKAGLMQLMKLAMLIGTHENNKAHNTHEESRAHEAVQVSEDVSTHGTHEECRAYWAWR